MENYLFIFGTLLSIIGFSVVWILNDFKNELKEARSSIQKLNENVAVVIRAIEYHDERISRLEETKHR